MNFQNILLTLEKHYAAQATTFQVGIAYQDYFYGLAIQAIVRHLFSTKYDCTVMQTTDQKAPQIKQLDFFTGTSDSEIPRTAEPLQLIEYRDKLQSKSIQGFITQFPDQPFILFFPNCNYGNFQKLPKTPSEPALHWVYAPHNPSLDWLSYYANSLNFTVPAALVSKLKSYPWSYESLQQWLWKLHIIGREGTIVAEDLRLLHLQPQVSLSDLSSALCNGDLMAATRFFDVLLKNGTPLLQCVDMLSRLVSALYDFPFAPNKAWPTYGHNKAEYQAIQQSHTEFSKSIILEYARVIQHLEQMLFQIRPNDAKAACRELLFAIALRRLPCI